LESVVHKAGNRVHLVGHSFGGLVALAVALRDRVPLASLVILEAPAPEILRDRGEHQHYRAFRQMTEAYFAAFDGGNAEAIAAMIDFYGGAGTYAAWPPRVRAYAIETTPVNIRDWASAYGFAPSAAALGALQIPTLVVRGGESNPAVQRANALLSECMGSAALATIDTAAHFMIATHSDEVGRLIAQHVHCAEAGQNRVRERRLNGTSLTMRPSRRMTGMGRLRRVGADAVNVGSRQSLTLDSSRRSFRRGPKAEILRASHRSTPTGDRSTISPAEDEPTSCLIHCTSGTNLTLDTAAVQPNTSGKQAAIILVFPAQAGTHV
jgi:hypothetical protein